MNREYLEIVINKILNTKQFKTKNLMCAGGVSRFYYLDDITAEATNQNGVKVYISDSGLEVASLFNNEGARVLDAIEDRSIEYVREFFSK